MSLVQATISAFNSKMFLCCVFHEKRFIEPLWCHQTCALYHLQNNLNITIKNKKFQTDFAVKTCKYSMEDIVKIIAYLLVFRYKNTKFFVILKIFCYLLNTLIAIKFFRFSTSFTFQILSFYAHFFSNEKCYSM